MYLFYNIDKHLFILLVIIVFSLVFYNNTINIINFIKLIQINIQILYFIYLFKNTIII